MLNLLSLPPASKSKTLADKLSARREAMTQPADPAPDFVWLNLWANSADKEMAQNKYNNSDLPTTTGAAFTCNNVDFSGVAIRR